MGAEALPDREDGREELAADGALPEMANADCAGVPEDAGMSGSSYVTVVSGLPRSGTSLMMRMLEMGGRLPVTDGLRAADPDNPKGYYEFERVKQLPKGDHAWVADAQGKSVKVISALLEHLPPRYEYRVIFMRRRMEEILASQREMLVRRGEPTDRTSDAAMSAIFDKHLQRIGVWVASRGNIALLDVEYARLIANPRSEAERLAEFLGGDLDVARMAAAVDADLYRQRAGGADPKAARG